MALQKVLRFMSEKYRNAIQPILNLQENCSEFFLKVNEKYKSEMACKSGCAKCCYVSLSVFQTEAYRIIEWVMSLDPTAKNNLRNILLQAEQPKGKNTKNIAEKPCVFLRDDRCAIYDARPTICRTQGLPLQYKVTEKEKEVQLVVDHCPLNFPDSEQFPDKNAWLDLDRLNTLQSIAENFFCKNSPKEALDRNLVLDKNKRVTLQSIKDSILELLDKN